MPDVDPKIDLLDNIDKLTQPNRSKIIQDGPVGSGLAGQKTVTVELPSLLDQLEAAIRGTIGIGGSGSLPNERNMLDADALYRFVMIKTAIGDWAAHVKSTVHVGDPSGTLRAWYVKYTQQHRELESVRYYLGKTSGWIYQIEAKLDPPRVRELPDRCPECQADSWWNPSDKHRYLHPLIVEYRPTGPNMIQEAKARCRACATEWAVRQLAYELEQRDAENIRQQELTNDSDVVHT
jgi:hypothetical protein